MARLAPGAYDCVLLDYYLPGVDTLALLQRMRAAAGDVPIVIITGRGDEDIAVEFMKAGAVDYLPKASLTPERLTTSFRYALEMAHRGGEAAGGGRTARAGIALPHPRERHSAARLDD
jgi:FixJ family two-component response regulator